MAAVTMARGLAGRHGTPQFRGYQRGYQFLDTTVFVETSLETALLETVISVVSAVVTTTLVTRSPLDRFGNIALTPGRFPGRFRTNSGTNFGR